MSRETVKGGQPAGQGAMGAGGARLQALWHDTTGLCQLALHPTPSARTRHLLQTQQRLASQRRCSARTRNQHPHGRQLAKQAGRAHKRQCSKQEGVRPGQRHGAPGKVVCGVSTRQEMSTSSLVMCSMRPKRCEAAVLQQALAAVLLLLWRPAPPAAARAEHARQPDWPAPTRHIHAIVVRYICQHAGDGLPQEGVLSKVILAAQQEEAGVGLIKQPWRRREEKMVRRCCRGTLPKPAAVLRYRVQC